MQSFWAFNVQVLSRELVHIKLEYIKMLTIQHSTSFPQSSKLVSFLPPTLSSSILIKAASLQDSYKMFFKDVLPRRYQDKSKYFVK